MSTETVRARKNPVRQLRIMTRDGKVKSVDEREADEAVRNGSANYISRTLFKAAMAGLDVKKYKGQSDKVIKEAIKKFTAPAEPEKKGKKA